MKILHDDDPSQFDWKGKGFGAAPEFKTAGPPGLLLYRCWGIRRKTGPGERDFIGSEEWGRYYAMEKPKSVLDAELRFNILEWDNGINFVTTFRLKQGFSYWVGPVAHGKKDMSIPALQVFIEGDIPLQQIKCTKMQEAEVLHHDVWVGPVDYMEPAKKGH